LLGRADVVANVDVVIELDVEIDVGVRLVNNDEDNVGVTEEDAGVVDAYNATAPKVADGIEKMAVVVLQHRAFSLALSQQYSAS
jgi:hypothetical protein